MGSLDIFPEINKHGVGVNEGVDVENTSDCLRKMKEMDHIFHILFWHVTNLIKGVEMGRQNKRGGDGASE